jgi:transcriptional regulator with XRE-family HTH domain
MIMSLRRTRASDDERIEIGKRLVEERLRLGLTQAALAEQADLSRLSVVNYETGTTVPGGEALIALDGAGLDIRYILVGKCKNDLVETRRRFARAFAEVSRQARANSEVLTDTKRLELSWRFYDALPLHR